MYVCVYVYSSGYISYIIGYKENKLRSTKSLLIEIFLSFFLFLFRVFPFCISILVCILHMTEC